MPTRKYHSLIDKVYAPSTLRRAYAKGARKSSAPGADGVSWKQYRALLPRHLTALSHRLQSGHYQPAPFRAIEKRTFTGLPIRICIPSVEDRIVEHAIRLVIEPIFEQHFFNFTAGYRPKRSRVSVLRQAYRFSTCGYDWVANIEIDRLTESIDHELLLAALGTYIADGKLLQLIQKDWQNSPGLPNGSALTTFLCNVYLHALDTLLQHEHVVRFSNIYAFFFPTYAEAEEALARITALLATYHLKIKPENTGIVFQPPTENLFLFDGVLDSQSRERGHASYA